MNPTSDRADGRRLQRARRRASALVLLLASTVSCTNGGAAGCRTAVGGPAPGPCERVSAATMSKLLDGAVRAEPDDRPGVRACRYLPHDGVAPYAELTIASGDARRTRLAGVGALPVGAPPRLSATGTYEALRSDVYITIDVPGQPAPLALAGRIAAEFDRGCGGDTPHAGPAPGADPSASISS